MAKLETLRAAGVEYVMLNAAGSGENLHRFAREVVPYLAARPCRRSGQVIGGPSARHRTP